MDVIANIFIGIALLNFAHHHTRVAHPFPLSQTLLALEVKRITLCWLFYICTDCHLNWLIVF